MYDISTNKKKKKKKMPSSKHLELFMFLVAFHKCMLSMTLSILKKVSTAYIQERIWLCSDTTLEHFRFGCISFTRPVVKRLQCIKLKQH